MLRCRLFLLTLSFLLATGARGGDAGPAAGAPDAGRAPARLSWEVIGPYRAYTRYLAVAPGNPDVVYGAGEVLMGVVASRDAGQTWRSSLEAMADQHPTVAGLIVDPDNADVLYAGTNRGIFKSTDGAKSWSLACETYVSYGIFCRAPGRLARFYASKDNSIRSSEDEFRAWRVLRKFDSITALAVHPKDSNVLLVGDRERCFVSRDGGKTWDSSRVDPGRPGLVRPVAASPAHPSVLYAARELGGKAHGDLYRSTDGGQTWLRVSLLPEEEALRKCLQVCAIAATADTPSRVFVGTTAGLFLGSDEGKGVHFDAEPKLSHRRVLHVAVVPTAKRVYAATDNGVYVSHDLGKSWSVSFQGIPRPDLYQVAAMPGTPGSLLAAQPGTLHLWQKGQWEVLKPGVHGIALGGGTGGSLFAIQDGSRRLLKSLDQGATWEEVLRTRERFFISGVASSQRGLWVVESRSGILHSADEGLTWQEIPLRLDSKCGAGGIVFDPLDPARIYLLIEPAGVWNLAGAGSVPEGWRSVPLKLCRSLDGGKTWLDAPEEGEIREMKVDFAMAVAGSGVAGRLLYAAPMRGVPVAQAAVARSRDGGKTWEAFGDQSGMRHILSLAVDPEQPKTVYAGSLQGRVFVSRDEGQSWNQLGERLDCYGVRQILPRPNGERALYVATGNGAYRWPAEP